MTRYLPSIAIGLSGALLCLSPALAQDNSVEVDPGLYSYHTMVTMAGQKMVDKNYEYCLTPDIARKDFSEIIKDLSDDGECQVKNLQVNKAAGTGSADVSCRQPDLGGITINGKVSAQFSSTHYNVVSNASINGMNLIANVKARRISACPAGWTPPPGISHK